MHHSQMLAPQLVGRLLPEIGGNPNVKRLLDQCDTEGIEHCALIPSYHCLHTPGGPLKYSLEGHQFAVFGFCLTADFRYIISISNKFITWDLSSSDMYRDVTPGIEGILQVPAVSVNDLDLDNLTDANVSDLERQEWLLAIDTKKLINSIYGTLMIFAFITCPLISNFVARFYKESGHLEAGMTLSNAGIWLRTHIALSYISLTCMWGAVGVVFFYDTYCDAKVTNTAFGCTHWSHSILGCIAMGVFHLKYVMGWMRPMGAGARTCYIWMYVLLGYGSQVLGVITYFTVSSDTNVHLNFTLAITLATATIFYIIATFLQKIADNRIVLEAPRPMFPVPEARNVPNEATCGICRTGLIIFFLVSQIVLFLWAFVAHGH